MLLRFIYHVLCISRSFLLSLFGHDIFHQFMDVRLFPDVVFMKKSFVNIPFMLVCVYTIFFLSEISVCKFSFSRIFLASFQSRPHLQYSNCNVCTSPFVMVRYFKNSYNSISLCPSNCSGSMYKSAMKERSTTKGMSESKDDYFYLVSITHCLLLLT